MESEKLRLTDEEMAARSTIHERLDRIEAALLIIQGHLGIEVSIGREGKSWAITYEGRP